MVETPARRLLRREERHASILHGAASAFAKSGFASTSMEDVAEACGVTKLIVYRHFDSKEELYRAILQRVFDRNQEEFTKAAVGAFGSAWAWLVVGENKQLKMMYIFLVFRVWPRVTKP